MDVEQEIAKYEELTEVSIPSETDQSFGTLLSFLSLQRLRPYISDTVWYINNAFKEGKKILIEGANAIMLDIDYGTYPFVTSSSTGCGGAATVRDFFLLIPLSLRPV